MLRAVHKSTRHARLQIIMCNITDNTRRGNSRELNSKEIAVHGKMIIMQEVENIPHIGSNLSSSWGSTFVCEA